MAENSKGNMPQGMRAIMGWVLGIGIIAFILLILLIIFGNLQGNVGFGQATSDVDNETIVFLDSGSVPGTAQNRTNGLLTVTTVFNETNGTDLVPATNYSVVGVVITALGDSIWNNTNVVVTGTVAYDTQGKIDTDNVILNYSKSATNTSAQFPTVGTIIGIAILLMILIALLVFAIVKMMGVTTATGSTNASFGGGSQGLG